MNIFKKYGIKEVADVVFYSITRIGDEEFYTPVLFFDTLKISNLTKTLETTNARGGKANKKLLSWNFENDCKLKLEDALFSQMSLDMFLNGRAMAKLTDWTSAIAKLNVANKYGQNNYSIKAFPSPKLTNAEKEIIFRCAQKAGYNPIDGTTIGNYNNTHQTKYLFDSDGMDKEEDSYVAENRKFLIENYYKRTQPTPHPRDLAPYTDYNSNRYDGVQILIRPIADERELEESLELRNLKIGEQKTFKRQVSIFLRDKEDEEYNIKNYSAPGLQNSLRFTVEKTYYGIRGVLVSIAAGTLKDKNNEDLPADFFPSIRYDQDWFDIGDNFVITHIPYFLFPNYLENAITNLCFCDQQNKTQLAMPLKIIDEINEEIDTFKKIGYFDNDLYSSSAIDRFEKCIVNNKKGQKIDLTQQAINLKKYYRNDQDSFTIFYDEKTMLPFMPSQLIPEKIYNQKSIRLSEDITDEIILNSIKDYFRGIMDDEWINSLTEKDYRASIIGNIVRFNIIKHEFITIKYGTVYYKWSRTINDDESNQTIIGTELLIDPENFSGEYMIVGETYIREQKTGKDQRYQLVLNCAALSSSTKINLQAGGEPTTFSIDIDLLAPKDKKKSMIELRQYDVEDDNFEGGTRIVPQLRNNTTTPFVNTEKDIIIPVENNEIY